MDLDIYQSSYMVDYKPYGKHKYSQVTSQEVSSHSVLSVQLPTGILISFLLCMWTLGALRIISDARRSKGISMCMCVYVLNDTLTYVVQTKECK